MKKLLGVGEKIFVFIAIFVMAYAFVAATSFTIIFSVRYNAPVQYSDEINNDLYIDGSSKVTCRVEIFRTIYNDDIIENNIDDSFELNMEPNVCFEYLKERYGYSDQLEYNEYTGSWEIRVSIEYPIEMQENYYYIRVDLAW